MLKMCMFYRIVGCCCLLFVYTVLSCGKQKNDGDLLPEDKDSVVRILAIGNSFSMDATERHLRELAATKGISVLIANLYISGASLQMHWDNAQNNRAAYEYRRIDQDGALVSMKDISLYRALVDDNWDYVCFQQASGTSGQYDTYVEPLPLLFDYVKTLMPDHTKFVFHQTWAYAQDSDNYNFAKYNNDQMEMYNAIVNATTQAYDLVDFDIFIPAGTAIQNGRTSVVDDQFTRDGYHLNELGRYTAACTWFEAIFQQSVIGNSYRPKEISEYDATIAQHAAHFAIGNPHAVTVLEDFAEQ